MGRPPRGGGFTREAALDAALALLDEGGPEGLTFRALARRLGVTPMAVAHRLGSRTDLVAALAARVHADTGAAAPAGPPVARIRALLIDYADRATAHPALLRCLFAEPQAIPARLDWLTDEIVLAAGAAGAGTPRTAAHALVDLAHGHALSRAASPEARADFAAELDWVLARLER